ncbi:hypothetical protein [Labilibaculum sp.]|nr:hypothetical protein [Labilibaculum sp.]
MLSKTHSYGQMVWLMFSLSAITSVMITSDLGFDLMPVTVITSGA